MPTQTISSSSDILVQQVQTIASSVTILTAQPAETLAANMSIFPNVETKDIAATFELTVDGVSDKGSTISVTQTIPAVPTLLTATDLKTGDKIRVTYTGSGPFYNIYYKKTIAGIFTKANATPTTALTYDIGGLDVGIDYTLMVRTVNGLGVESSDSNTIP